MMKHYSVLLEESIDLLDVKEDGIYVDGTLGRGGHSLKIAEKLTTGHLYGFDKDLTAIEESKETLKNYIDKVTFIHSDFENIKEELSNRGINKIDGMIMDLGVSSPQFDDEDRGFSYRFDSRLDMRMDQSKELDAYYIINNYDFSDLVRIMSRYGEEPFAKQIARKIEKQREVKPIETTFELVDVIKSALPSKVLSKKGHPAKKVFQAIRIEVNQELDSLTNGLYDALEMLNHDGKIAVISFHSLEDRIVKQIFNEVSKEEKVNKRVPLLNDKEMEYELINRKPVLPTEKENQENKRSHSAKLRVIRRK